MKSVGASREPEPIPLESIAPSSVVFPDSAPSCSPGARRDAGPPRSSRCKRAFLRIGCLLALGGGGSCADELPPLGSADEGDSALSQVAAPVLPTSDQTVVMQTRQRVPIEITGNLGTGCEGKLTVNEKAREDGRLQVYFKDYRLRFLPNTLTYDSKDCTVELKVTGARGYRYAIQQVTYVGSASLYSAQAEARFSSTVWWSGRGPEQPGEPKVITGVYVKDWVHTQSFQFEESGQSACFRGSDERDEITIKTTMILFNPDSKMPAEVMLNSLISEASVVTTPAASSVTVELEAQPCTPAP